MTPVCRGGNRRPYAQPRRQDTGVFLTWYDTVNQDLMMGQYADVQNLIVANPQPSITVSAAPGGGEFPANDAAKHKPDRASQNDEHKDDVCGRETDLRLPVDDPGDHHSAQPADGG